MTTAVSSDNGWRKRVGRDAVLARARVVCCQKLQNPNVVQHQQNNRPLMILHVGQQLINESMYVGPALDRLQYYRMHPDHFNSSFPLPKTSSPRYNQLTITPSK